MDFKVRACNARVLTQRNKDAKKTRMGIFCFEILFVVFWLVFPLRLGVLSDSGRENWSGGTRAKKTGSGIEPRAHAKTQRRQGWGSFFGDSFYGFLVGRPFAS